MDSSKYQFIAYLFASSLKMCRITNFLGFNSLFVKGTKNTFFAELLKNLDLKSVKCSKHNRLSENIIYALHSYYYLYFQFAC